MGSGRTNQEIALYTAQVISDLEEYLHHLTVKGEPTDKRADKIDQWIEKWTKYLKLEERFNPRSLPAFKRGSIVYVDLGFNVGSEYGGVHYAIVLNKKDSRNNHLLHILPLTSIKSTTDLDNLKYYQLSLSDEIHRLLTQKGQKNLDLVNEKKEIFEKKLNALNNKISEIQDILEKSENLSKTNPQLKKYLEDELGYIQNEQSEINEILSDYLSQIEYLDKLVNKIRNLKKGSIALLNQVTTISKLRVLDPINKHSLLSGITVTSETLDIIDEALKNIL